MKRAVLIASANFEPDSGIETLRFPANDVNALETILRSEGFDFETVLKIIDEPNNIVNEKAGISPEMAIRLSKAFGSTPDTWVRMQAAFDLAVALNAKGKRQEAVDHLTEIVRRDRKWNDDGARKQLVQFFEAWGPTDEATVNGRKRLSSILFA